MKPKMGVTVMAIGSLIKYFKAQLLLFQFLAVRVNVCPFGSCIYCVYTDLCGTIAVTLLACLSCSEF